MNKFKLPLFSLVQRIEKGTNLQYLRQLDSCFGNGAKRISRNSIFVSGMERSGFPETLYLFREWSEADFPKLLCYLGFGKSYLIPETINFDIGEGIKEMNEFKLPLFSLVPRIKK